MTPEMELERIRGEVEKGGLSEADKFRLTIAEMDWLSEKYWIEIESRTKALPWAVLAAHAADLRDTPKEKGRWIVSFSGLPNFGEGVSLKRERMLAFSPVATVASRALSACCLLDSSSPTLQLGGHFSTLLRLPPPGSGFSLTGNLTV